MHTHRTGRRQANRPSSRAEDRDVEYCLLRSRDGSGSRGHSRAVPRGREASMAKWFFEPGHTAAEFCVRHMMVTYVRGHFKNVRGTLEFDERNPGPGAVEVVIDVRGL